MDGAIELYGRLLATPLAKGAAEKLSGILANTGREREATLLRKQYLAGCCH
ncbi:MAG: hypothetical protein HGA35_02385 [Erysipelotrichaceae bacterium]|nr:hypothetical protein [Erysipelotrichaceae bacterium]